MVRDYETGVGIEHADRVMGEREVWGAVIKEGIRAIHRP